LKAWPHKTPLIWISIVVLLFAAEIVLAAEQESRWICEKNELAASFDRNGTPVISEPNTGTVLLSLNVDPDYFSTYRASSEFIYLKCSALSDIAISCTNESFYLYLNTETKEGSVNGLSQDVAGLSTRIQISPLTCNAIS
jgi:hypothetical protein